MSTKNTRLDTESTTTVYEQYGIAFPDGDILWAEIRNDGGATVAYTQETFWVVRAGEIQPKGVQALADRFHRGITDLGGTVTDYPYLVRRQHIQIYTKAERA